MSRYKRTTGRCSYEPDSLTVLQRSTDHHLTQDHTVLTASFKTNSSFSKSWRLPGKFKDVWEKKQATCCWNSWSSRHPISVISWVIGTYNSRSISKFNVVYALIHLHRRNEHYKLTYGYFETVDEMRYVHLYEQDTMGNRVKIPEHFNPKYGAHRKALINVQFDCMWIRIPVITATMSRQVDYDTKGRWTMIPKADWVWIDWAISWKLWQVKQGYKATTPTSGNHSACKTWICN